MACLKNMELRNYRLGIINDYVSSIAINERKIFKSKFSESEKVIADCLYSKRYMFSDIEKHYREIRSFIDSILKSIGFSNDDIQNYFKNESNIELFFMTKEQIIRRLAILNYGGIDVKCAFENSHLLVRYSDTLVYNAIKKLKEIKQVMQTEEICDYINNNDNVNIESKASTFAMDYLMRSYIKKCNMEGISYER